MGKGPADPAADRVHTVVAPAGRRCTARRPASDGLIESTTSSVLLRTLAAIGASDLPPELEQHLLLELRARFPDHPEDT